MSETVDNITNNRLVIRVSKNSLSFSVIDKESEDLIRFEPYTVKSGVSIPANLREAFKTSELLQLKFKKVQVILSTPVLFIPIEEFQDENKETLYKYSFIGYENNIVMNNVLPDMNVVAVFSINKDLKVVIDDHFEDTRFMSVSQPVWYYLHQRSFTGVYQKLYCYFHDKKLDVFCFDKNRFKFSNTFCVTHSLDAVYYILHVWNQLAMDVRKDELHVVGTIPGKTEFIDNLHRYLQKVYVLNPSAEFNRAPITQIKGLPFDLLTFFARPSSKR